MVSRERVYFHDKQGLRSNTPAMNSSRARACVGLHLTHVAGQPVRTLEEAMGCLADPSVSFCKFKKNNDVLLRGARVFLCSSRVRARGGSHVGVNRAAALRARPRVEAFFLSLSLSLYKGMDGHLPRDGREI